MRRAAFTMVELIVVIAVVAVLALISLPVASRVSQGSKAAACISNLHELGVALNLYLGDNREIMPALKAARSSISDQVPVIDNTLNAYAKDPRVFACPADNQNLAASTGTSYFWNVALDNQPVSNLSFLGLSNSQSEIPILSDKAAFHPYTENKVNLLYADGHATQDIQFYTGQ